MLSRLQRLRDLTTDAEPTFISHMLSQIDDKFSDVTHYLQLKFIAVRQRAASNKMMIHTCIRNTDQCQSTMREGYAVYCIVPFIVSYVLFMCASFNFIPSSTF